jgi:hypothetical protein
MESLSLFIVQLSEGREVQRRFPDFIVQFDYLDPPLVQDRATDLGDIDGEMPEFKNIHCLFSIFADYCVNKFHFGWRMGAAVLVIGTSEEFRKTIVKKSAFLILFC